jgi:hypothetical protein
VEDIQGVNAGHRGHVSQTADEFLFGIGCAELWEERKFSNGFPGAGNLGVSSHIPRHWSTSQRSGSGPRSCLRGYGWRALPYGEG